MRCAQHSTREDTVQRERRIQCELSASEAKDNNVYEMDKVVTSGVDNTKESIDDVNFEKGTLILL